MGTVFDPLGFLSPVTIRAKILFQELWMGKYTWDEPLPADIIKKWAAISTDLEQAVQFTTNRRYFQSKENIQIIHIFVDASQKAFGAAAYLTDGSTAALVAAKTRVASLEKRTLPQRELEAAELGTKLAETNPPEWDEDEDPTFTLTTTNLVATAQLKSKVIHDFMARWKHEYLSALREFQQHTSGKNCDVIQPGDVVIVHDDNKPRLSWNLAVVESLIRGESGNVYSANIRTSQGKTNRPIRKLYPLEVRAAQEPIDESPSPPSECVAGNQQPESSPEQPESSPEPMTDLNPARRSTRRAAANAKGRIAAWAALLQPQ